MSTMVVPKEPTVQFSTGATKPAELERVSDPASANEYAEIGLNEPNSDS